MIIFVAFNIVQTDTALVSFLLTIAFLLFLLLLRLSSLILVVTARSVELNMRKRELDRFSPFFFSFSPSFLFFLSKHLFLTRFSVADFSVSPLFFTRHKAQTCLFPLRPPRRLSRLCPHFSFSILCFFLFCFVTAMCALLFVCHASPPWRDTRREMKCQPPAAERACTPAWLHGGRRRGGARDRERASACSVCAAHSLLLYFLFLGDCVIEGVVFEGATIFAPHLR